jgi:Holliday junction resolvasome RuvABC ATP-dependent DNA helicase subunit
MERSGDLVAILTGLEPRDILFIDEIHRMPSNVEEVLYNAMEHFCVDVIIGQGAGANQLIYLYNHLLNWRNNKKRYDLRSFAYPLWHN